MQKLPNKWYDKYIQAWEHLDFIWGLDAGPLVYDDVINRIIKIENRSWPADLGVQTDEEILLYCVFKVGIQIQKLFEYYIILLCCQY